MAHLVVLFGKPGCHLCDDALTLLEETGHSLNLDLDIQQVDITNVPELQAQYGDIIPVIAIEDGFTLTAPIHPRVLRDALAAAVMGA